MGGFERSMFWCGVFVCKNRSIQGIRTISTNRYGSIDIGGDFSFPHSLGHPTQHINPQKQAHTQTPPPKVSCVSLMGPRPLGSQDGLRRPVRGELR